MTGPRDWLDKVQRTREEHRERHRPSGYHFALADRIDFLDGEHWDEVVDAGSYFLSREYLRVVEQAGPRELTARYALAYRESTPVAAVAGQIVEVSGLDVRQPRDEPAKRVRRVKEKALEKVRARVLVCGNLLSWGFHGVHFRGGEPAEDAWPAVAEALYRIRRADRLSGQMDYVLVKDVPEADWPAMAPLERFSYRPFQTDPDMVLDLDPGWRTYEDYLSSLKAKYRKTARQFDAALAAAGCVIDSRVDLDRESGRLHALYEQVARRAQVRLVHIPAAYLPALARAAGDRFRLSVIRRDSNLLGFVTTLKDGPHALGYLIGVDQDANRELPIYLRLLQETIDHGIVLGCERLSLGRTALEPKSRLGARPVPTSVWIRHRIPVINLLVRRLLRAVPHGEAPERSPFRE